MADMQRAGMTGTASMRIPLNGTVNVGGKIMKELRFMPYSEFPETGREETLYIDTDGNTLYYYDGTYIALSGGGGGGTGDYNELANKPQINGNTLNGNKTAANLGLQETISDLAAIRSGAASGRTAVQPATLETALETKQDTISDLASIRTGASKGDTAVQPADMETALSEKQDTIQDLQTIRSGSALGATAVQPADMETALADKQDVISDLDAIRSGATAGNTALQPEDIDTLPTDGSSNPVSSGGTYNFVNSSIATNTAYFIGTFASVAELEAYTGTVTNNDYAFVTSTDSAGNTLYNRYKYNAATQVWSFEYAVNNTAFTAAQWAAIQSGMTSADKTKLDGIEQGANKTVIDASPTSGSSNAVSSGGVYTALSGKQDIIADLTDIRSGASAGATAVQPSALNDYQTKLSGTNKLDPSFIEYDASHRAVSDSEKSTWNDKQDMISDLATIRSGAAAGATALQQSDVASTYSASGTAPVNGTAVNTAIETLDVASVGGSGKYISAISEENGKIEATPTTFDTALSSSSTDNNAPTSKTVFDDQERQEVEIGVVANAGAKNLLRFDAIGSGVSNYGKTYTHNGITYTLNADMTVTATGTADSANNSYTYLILDGSYAPIDDYVDGNHILSGCPANGSTSKYRMYIVKSGWGSLSETGSGEIIPDKGTYTGFLIACFVSKGYAIPTGEPLVFKPMIRPASITDSAFVPYAKTNVELTIAEDEDRAALTHQVDEGAKNKVDIANSTISVSTFVFENAAVSLSAGSYVFSYTSDQLTAGNIELVIRNGTTVLNRVTISSQTGRNEIPFTISSEANNIRLYSVRAGTYSDFMLCTAADYAISKAYVPYALPNPVITPALIEQVDNGAKSIFPIDVLSKDYSSTLSMTVDNEGVITVNGTRNDSSGGILYQDLVTNKTRYQDTRYTLPVGTYGCKGGGTESIRLQVYCHDGTNATQLFNSSEDGTFTYSQTQKESKPYITFRLAIQPGNVSLNNHKVYPMICTAADWAVSQKFVPHRPSWQEMADEIETKATITDIFGIKPTIASGTDLNSMTIPGVYSCNGATLASTLLNCPTNTSAFVMFVDNISSSSRVIQRLYAMNTNTGAITVYIRGLYANGWGAWYKFEGTAVT